jgi:antitoxin component HigA of HigAB toxin-antitoxin module
MNLQDAHNDTTYRTAMGQLLVLYTQVDRLIMQACAERIATAPDEAARLGLAKQVGDESRHVAIQNEWMQSFATDRTPVISAAQEAAILAHFRQLDWMDFLTDMYLCVEALGSDAVEKVVPLADPGTRESLRVPLQDELDHIAFGIDRLRHELAQLQAVERDAYLDRIPQRIEALNRMFQNMGLDVQTLFEAVGTDYDMLCESLLKRKSELLQQVATPLAA